MSGDDARIRSVVLDYLSGIQDLSTVKTKDVRNHVLNTLALPKDYFGGDAKEILLSVISNYQIPLAAPKNLTPVKATSARSTPVKASLATKTTPRKETPVRAERLITPQKSPHKSYDGSSEEDTDEKGSPTLKKTAKPIASAAAAKKVAKKNSMKRTFDGEVDSSSDEEDTKAALRQRPMPTKAPRLSAAVKSPEAAQKAPKSPKAIKTPKATTPRTPRTDESDAGYDGEYKTGRFTKFESDTIREAAQRYAAEQGIEVTDLCTQYKKEDGGEKSKHLPFWREVKELLPHRKKEVRILR